MTAQAKRPSTRDAVETAIDLSKQDKSATWEELILKGRRSHRHDEREKKDERSPTQVEVCESSARR